MEDIHHFMQKLCHRLGEGPPKKRPSSISGTLCRQRRRKQPQKHDAIWPRPRDKGCDASLCLPLKTTAVRLPSHPGCTPLDLIPFFTDNLTSRFFVRPRCVVFSPLIHVCEVRGAVHKVTTKNREEP